MLRWSGIEAEVCFLNTSSFIFFSSTIEGKVPAHRDRHNQVFRLPSEVRPQISVDGDAFKGEE